MSKQRVLLIEDSRETQVMVEASLGDVCALTSVLTIAQGEQELRKNHFDLLLLDIHLPDRDGIDFCRDLREQKRYADLPIVFLTGEQKLERKVLGFEVGGDDYITKPFEPDELKARVLRKLRRAPPKRVASSVQVGPFKVDLQLQKITLANEQGAEQVLPLTPIEFKLLNHFLQNEGRIFSRQDLLELFWGGSVYVSKHTVDTHISSLRKKMGQTAPYLRNIFKKGYCLSLPDHHSRIREMQPEV